MKRLSIFLSLFSLCLLLTNLSAQVPTERILLGNFSKATISIRSLAPPGYQEVGTVKVGTSPRSLAVLPGGRLAIVADLNSGYMSLIDFTANAEVTRIRGARGRYMALTSDGKLAVTALGEIVTVVDTSTLQMRTVSLNGKVDDDPLTADVIEGKILTVGHHAYMNPNGPWPVVMIDLDNLQVKTIPGSNVGTGPRQQSIALTPDGSKLLVLRTGVPDPRYRMLIIDTATNTISSTFDPGPGSNIIGVPAGTAPGRWGYVVQNNPGGGGRFLRVLDLRKNLPVLGPGFQLPVPNVIDMDFTADGRRLFALNPSSPSSLVVVDTTVLRSGVGNPILGNLDAGPSESALRVAQVQTRRPLTAPVVTGISPNVVVNDAPRTIVVTGSHFAPDALVRVGTLDPLTPTQATSSRLQVQLPATSAAQLGDIIVTNQNRFQPLAEQHQSGILRGKFTIYASPQYQPEQQVLASNFGESTVTQLHAGAAALPMFDFPNDWLMGIGFSDDANHAYIPNASIGEVNVIDIAGNAILPSIPLPGAPGQGTSIAMAHHPGTGKPVAYVGSYIYNQDQDTYDEQLQIIDADPASSTYNSVMDTINGGLSNTSTYRGGLAATPDGSFVYYWAMGDTNYLMIFDVANHSSSHLPMNFLGNPDWVPNLRLTENGRYMVSLADGDRALAVLDLADRWNPVRVATITATPPPGATVNYLGAFDLVGNRLFAWDGVSHVVYAFNFEPASSNYAQLGSFTIPAVQLIMQMDTITASPDGRLLYVPLGDEDDVAVLDTARVVAGIPSALLTKIHTGVGTYFAGLRPGTPTPAGAQVTVLPMQGVTATFDNVTIAGATTAAATNTHPLPTPLGFRVSNPPLFYRLDTTAEVVGKAEVCFAYDPAWFADGSVRALHEESGAFIDRTVSLDRANHVVCAQVGSLGSFVLGSPACSLPPGRTHC